MKINKSLYFLLLAFFSAALLVGMNACKKIKSIKTFTLNYSSEVTVPGTLGVNTPFDIFTPEIATNSEAAFQGNDTRADLVKTIILDKVKLTLTSPSGSSLNFLNSVEVFINADGLPEAKIASKTDIPESVGSNLDLETSGSDLKEYIKKEKYRIRVAIKTDKLLTQDHTIKVDESYKVEANLL